MGRIVTTVDIQNVMEPSFAKKLDILVDTRASHHRRPACQIVFPPLASPPCPAGA